MARRARAFTEEVERVLRRNGYDGPATQNTVPPSLRAEMEDLRAAGVPTVGNVEGLATGALAIGTNNNSRW